MDFVNINQMYDAMYDYDIYFSKMMPSTYKTYEFDQQYESRWVRIVYKENEFGYIENDTFRRLCISAYSLKGAIYGSLDLLSAVDGPLEENLIHIMSYVYQYNEVVDDIGVRCPEECVIPEGDEGLGYMTKDVILEKYPWLCDNMVFVQAGDYNDGGLANTRRSAKKRYDRRRRNKKKAIAKEEAKVQALVEAYKERRAVIAAIKADQVAKAERVKQRNLGRLIAADKEAKRLKDKLEHDIRFAKYINTHYEGYKIPIPQEIKEDLEVEDLSHLFEKVEVKSEVQQQSDDEEEEVIQTQDGPVESPQNIIVALFRVIFTMAIIGVAYGVSIVWAFTWATHHTMEETVGIISALGVRVWRSTSVIAINCYRDMYQAARTYLTRHEIISIDQNGLVFNITTDTPNIHERHFEDALHVVEKLYLLISSLMNVKDTSTRLKIVLLFVSSHTEKGITNVLIHKIHDLMTEPDVQVEDGLADAVMSIEEKWKMYKDSRATHRMLELASHLVVTTMSHMLKLELDKFDIRGYLLHNRDEKKNAPLLELIIDEVLFFIKKGLTYFETKSIVGVFYDDDKSKEYDERYAELVSKFAHVETNNMATAGGMSMNTYLARLEICRMDTVKLSKSFEKVNDRRFMVERLIRINKMIDATKTVVNGLNSRIKPYGILLHGDPGVGKTMLKELIMKFIMVHNPRQFSDGDNTICTMNGDDAYQTEVNNGHQVLVLDDLANSMPLFAKNNPCQSVINILNNEPKAVLKADLDSKGKVYYNNNLLVVTANDPTLQSKVYSVAAAAVMRRFDVVVEVKVKPEYQGAGGVSIDPSKVDSLFTDIWDLRVYKNVPTSNSEVITVDCQYEGQKLEECSFEQLCKYVEKDSKTHFAKQEQLLADQVNIRTMSLCEHGMLSKMCSQCVVDVSAEIGAHDVKNLCKVAFNIHTIKHAVIDCLTIYTFKIALLHTILLTLGFGCKTSVAMYLVMIPIAFVSMMKRIELIRREPFFKMEEAAKQLKYAGGVLGTGISLMVLVNCLMKVKAVYKLNTKVFAEGGTYGRPVTVPENPVNVWEVKHRPHTLVEHKLATMTTDQGISLLKNKIGYVIFNGSRTTNIFPIMSNVWLANWHSLDGKTHEIEVLINGRQSLGPNFKTRVHPVSYRRIGQTDLAVVFLPAGGSQRNLIHMLPIEPVLVPSKGHMIYKREDGSFMEDEFYCEPKVMDLALDTGGRAKGFGITYTTSAPTFPGLCMAPIVSAGKSPVILGFHFGSGKTGEGHAQQITQNDLTKALKSLFEGWDNPNVRTASAGEPKLVFPEHDIGVEYGVVDPKCPSNFLTHGTVKIYGKVVGQESTYFSQVTELKIAKDVAEQLETPIKFGPPKNIRSYKPRYAEFEKACNTKELPAEYVKQGMSDFIDKVSKYLDANRGLKTRLGKIDDDVNLAGLDGKRGYEPINRASSMGFPINKPKKEFVWFSDKKVEGISAPRETRQEFWDEVEAMEEKLKRGERIYPIAKAHLKDEPKKIGSEKVRVFYGVSFAFLLLMRRYFLSISKFYMDHPDIFETTVGINVFGPEWQDMAERLTKESFDRVLAGDFRSWDSVMSAMMILVGGKILMFLAAWSGQYSEDDLKVMEGIFTELSNPLVDFFGTYVEFMGCMISGHSLTIVLNDIIQKIYHRTIYYSLYKGVVPCSFDKMVTLKTNGDDNIMSVMRSYGDEFNHTSIANEYAKYGIEYTMADKEAESVPFIRLEDADYLKRKFRYSIRHERYHPALDKDSIIKSIQVGIPSKDLCEDELCAININGALQEAYYHGRSFFDKMREGLDVVAEKHSLYGWMKNNRLKTYEECEKFDVEQFTTGRQGPIVNETVEVQNGTYSKIPVAEWDQNTNLYNGIGYRGCSGFISIARAGLPLDASSPRGAPLFRGRLAPNMMICPDVRNLVILGENKEVSFTNSSKVFADVTNNVSTASQVDEHQTLNFRDGPIGQWISAIPNIFDRTRDVAMSDDVPLDKFFERPILVQSYLWDPAAIVKFYQTFDPWTQYFGNSRIINRLNNYQLLRAKLKVKFIVNGNSFYYGRLMVDYGVRTDQDSVSLYATGTTLNPLMGASQRLHILLDPTESQGGILCLPYISEYNNMRVPEAQWSQQGRVYIREMSPLKHANGSVNPVSISVYVWAEDVKLSIPTQENSSVIITQAGELLADSDRAIYNTMLAYGIPESDAIKIVTQKIDGKVAGFTGVETAFETEHPYVGIRAKVYAGLRGFPLKEPEAKELMNELNKIIDTDLIQTQAGEYGTSAVSKMMSSVAGIAGRLIDAPIIGAYAKATQMTAQGVGGLARLFGFSRAPQIENQTLMRRFFVGPMTNTDRGDTATKLTVDSKQELTVDPRTFGVMPVDELGIGYLASKETWFARFPWATTDRINKLLFTAWVTPSMYNYVAPYYHTTAACFATQPFEFWRGTVIYRFNIVASAFHRGRLLFAYAPNQQLGVAQTQTQYTRIVDLSNERDFTMQVCWASERSFLRVGNVDPIVPWSTAPLGGSGELYNGTISVYVLNDLTSPSDVTNNDITIHVFMKCGDDLGVAMPVERYKQYTYLNTVAPQDGVITTQAGDLQETTPETNAPVKEEIEECVAKDIEMDNTFDVYFGEEIPTFRLMLKRYMYHTSYYLRGAAAQSNYVVDNDFPVFRGFTAEGRHPTTTTPFNIVTTTLLNYLAPAFVGYRGSTRYKYIARPSTATTAGKFAVSRATTNFAYDKGVGFVPNTANDSVFATTTNPFYTLFTGGEVTDLSISPVLEVELPYYSNRRFTFTRALTTFVTGGWRNLCHILELTASTTGTVVDRYVSTGEDFTFFLFQGQPPFQITPNPAVPTT